VGTAQEEAGRGGHGQEGGGAGGSERRAVYVLHPKDNVGTALRDLAPGEVVRAERHGAAAQIEVRHPIPFGHKLALEPISRGEPVLKYGEAIGLASEDIAPGEHVHVHNVESQRGRGDLAPRPDGA
jgi:altronate dehydratase small subunit